MSERLRDLARRPGTLLLVLLALNACARPYANIDHDTRLYSVQVLNRLENGTYDHDLFFQYGSQDRYSVFSPLMAPLVNVMGLEPAFFVVYLFGNAFLIAGMMRLVLRLIEDATVAVLSLFYLVTAGLAYGGHGILQVQEPFLTPRILAVGLVLWGLEQLLAKRPMTTLVLLIGALLLHPLMAAGGWLILAGVVVVGRVGWKGFWICAGVVGVVATGVLAMPEVARRILGEMDEPWRDAIRNATSFNFTDEWERRDWMNVAMCFVGAVAGYFILPLPSYSGGEGRGEGGQDSQTEKGEAAKDHVDQGRPTANHDAARGNFPVTPDPSPPSTGERGANLCAIAGLVGVAAVLGTMLAERLPYALLFQGQPYRALWVLKVLQVPLCFLFAWRLWQGGNPLQRLLSLAIFVCFFSPNLIRDGLFPVLLFLPFMLVPLRGLDSRPRRPDWLICGIAIAFINGAFLEELRRITLLRSFWEVFLAKHDTIDFVRVLIGNVGPLTWTVLAIGLVHFVRSNLLLRVLGLAVYLSVSAGFWLVPQTDHMRTQHTRYLADFRFARDYLRDRAEPGKLPRVYNACGRAYGRLEYVWLEMRAVSYFDWWQASGFMFARPMALEGQRRALIVAPFEVALFKEYETFLPEYIKSDLERFFQRPLDAPGPTVDDLARLCWEDNVDYAILRQEFPGLVAATNGEVFIYDCRELRNRLPRPQASRGP